MIIIKINEYNIYLSISKIIIKTKKYQFITAFSSYRSINRGLLLRPNIPELFTGPMFWIGTRLLPSVP